MNYRYRCISHSQLAHGVRSSLRHTVAHCYSVKRIVFIAPCRSMEYSGGETYQKMMLLYLSITATGDDESDDLLLEDEDI